MTTIAFDGKTMAADTLVTDWWGLKDTTSKIFKGVDFIVGLAGRASQQIKWVKAIQGKTLDEVLDYGYPSYKKEDDDPAILLVSKLGMVWTHTEGVFRNSRRSYHAIGSGRDFALMAMRLGHTAQDAVRLAAEFNNDTNDRVDVVELA